MLKKIQEMPDLNKNFDNKQQCRNKKMRRCPICDSNKNHDVDRIKLINFDGRRDLFDEQIIKACDKCGFIFHDGLDFGKFSEHYGSYTTKGTVHIAEMTADELVLNNNMVSFIESKLCVSKEANILDVGCGYGWVLGLLKEHGYRNIHGIDTDALLMQELGNKYSVSVGDCETEIEDFENKFDVVTIKMVMEHLEFPRKAIDNLRKWIKNNGILVIEVPDCLIYERTAFFPGYFQSVNMEHINNYSMLSLLNLMNEWEPVIFESTDSNGIFPVLRAAFRKVNHVKNEIIYNPNDETVIKKSLYIWAERSKELRERIENIVSSQKSIAIWGVSAFTRGLLTYTNLKNANISFFIDRNKKYQKRTLIGKIIKDPDEVAGFDGKIIIPGKTSQGAILKNISELRLTNEVICLSLE